MNRKKKFTIPLLPAVIIAIILGIVCGLFFPDWLVRVFLSFNSLFSNFLGFIIPLLILGLVAPSIADLGKKAGKLLFLTTLFAYAFTLFAGFFTYFTSMFSYPLLLGASPSLSSLKDITAVSLKPFFTVGMPPLMSVMTALVLAFVLGMGMAVINGDKLKGIMDDFKDIINKIIHNIIIPFLPLYIFGIFLDITVSGQVAGIMGIFIKLIVFIFLLTIILLLLQFSLAGLSSKRNPIKLLANMMPAYATALGTQSSAATIPVTLEQTLKNDVKSEIADFVVPLCATIHLSGSTMKIVACSLAVMMVSGMDINFMQYGSFIMMLGITMVAAPAVPGGAIMAAVGILQTMLGFDETAIGLMIALYIAMDSFGTACNVTGDGAIAVIINRIYKGK